MNKKGDFYVSYEMVLSIARILVLIIFALGFSALIGSVVKKEVSIWNVEANEVANSLIQCSLTNYNIDELKLNSLDKCIKNDAYAAKLNYKEKEFFLNKGKTSFFGLCNTKRLFCKEFYYVDGNKDILKMNVMVSR